MTKYTKRALDEYGWGKCNCNRSCSILFFYQDVDLATKYWGKKIFIRILDILKCLNVCNSVLYMKKKIYIIWIDVSLAFRKKRTVCPRSHVYICIVTHYMKMDMTFLAAKQPCKSACLSVCLPVCLSACLSEAISPYSKSLQATHPENLWLYPTFCCECHYEKKISNLVLPPVQNDFLCLKLKNLLTTPCNNRNNF